MCDGTRFTPKLTSWSSFTDAARSGRDGFDAIPKRPGIYAVRVTAVGESDIAKIKANYLASEFFRAMCAVDAASEDFFAGLGLGAGWGWRAEAYAAARLGRLDRLRFSRGRLICPLIYVGCTNKLQSRMIQLAWWGHTANHPIWALLLAKWKIEIGIRETDLHAQRAAEAELKVLYGRSHGNALPALVQI